MANASLKRKTALSKVLAVTGVEPQVKTGELLPRKEGQTAKERQLAGLRLGNMGKGRRKGQVNVVTKQVKEVILRCFDNIGGEQAFATWAKENRKDFYRIYAKLLPLQLQMKETKDININITKDEAAL